MTATGPTTSASERSFHRLLDRMRDAATVITGPKGARSERERAEGFRYLTRVLGASLEMHLENADPDRPTTTRMLSPIRKFLGDNPDTDYDYVPLSPGNVYRIVGHRTNVTYVGFCVYRTRDEGGLEVDSNLSDAELVFEPDGRFEILVSAERPEGATNWLALGPRAYAMLVRQYFLDRTSEHRSAYSIERIGSDGGPPSHLTEASLAPLLDRAADYVVETADLSASLSLFAQLNPVTDARMTKGGEVAGGVVDEEKLERTQALLEAIDPSVILGHMPTPDITYTGASFELDEDGSDAVLIEGVAPRARYWSVQIFNRWLESPDYRVRRVALNSKDVVLDASGRFRIVLSARDPGVPNWIDSAGLRTGQIAIRALLAEDDLDVELVRVDVASLARGPEVLP